MNRNKPKVIFLDCYQTLIDIDIDEETRKNNEQKGWERFVDLLYQDHALRISTKDLISLLDQRKADFYAKNDKMFYHHDLSAILSEIFRNDLGHPMPHNDLIALIYEYRKLSRGYLELHHPSIPSILELLYGKYTLAIVSHTQGSFTRLELNELGIARYLSYFVFSSDIGLRKESPDFYKKCLDVSGKSPSDVMMIGDNPREDVEIPARLGINTIWLNNSDIGLETGSGPSICLKDFDKLPELIDDIFANNKGNEQQV